MIYNLQELVGVGSIIFVISLVLIALIVIVYSIYSWNKEINEMNDYEHPSIEPDPFTTQPINPLIHDISDPVVPDFEVAYFDPKSNKSENKISIVFGDKIKFWYHRKNYVHEYGDLGCSCMKYDECQDYFGIYTENPEQSNTKYQYTPQPDGSVTYQFFQDHRLIM